MSNLDLFSYLAFIDIFVSLGFLLVSSILHTYLKNWIKNPKDDKTLYLDLKDIKKK